MGGRIFINYRREDSIATAGRLHDRLSRAFGRKSLFMDVDHIPAGVDFVIYLEEQVGICDVFLAVIGPHWLSCRDSEGQLRLGNPNDFVAVEIGAALTRNIRVIPVLLDGAQMPRADQLPAALKALNQRNAVEVRNAQFGSDADRLVEKIRDALNSRSRWAKPVRLTAAALGTAALIGLVGLYYKGDGAAWMLRMLQPGDAARRVDADAALKNASVKPPADQPAAPEAGLAPPTIVGAWKGKYYYTDGRAIEFAFLFEESADTCRGRSEEPSTFGNGTTAKLTASLTCTAVTLFPGLRIAINKQYDGSGGVDHAVRYAGTVSDDLRSIMGEWTARGNKGTFTLRR